jgi:hypothetical protein
MIICKTFFWRFLYKSLDIFDSLWDEIEIKDILHENLCVFIIIRQPRRNRGGIYDVNVNSKTLSHVGGEELIFMFKLIVKFINLNRQLTCVLCETWKGSRAKCAKNTTFVWTFRTLCVFLYNNFLSLGTINLQRTMNLVISALIS